MSVCTDAKLLEGFPGELKRTVWHNEIRYERYFFNGLVSTTIDASNYPAWDEAKTDYKKGDRVLIAELNTVYLCGEDGNTEYPPSSSMWKAESSNDYRQIDMMPTSKSVSNDNEVINIYNVLYSTHLIGQFIDGVKNIVVEELDNNFNPTGNILADIKMTRVIDFTCFSCCNPPPIKKRSFVIDLKKKKCSTKYIQVKLIRSETSQYIEIGTLVPVRAINIGKPGFDLRVKVDNGLSFRKIGISGHIDAIPIGSTISLTGKTTIESREKERLFEMLIYYKGVTFTITDVKNLRVIGGVVMGKFTPTNGLHVGLFDNMPTDFKFKKEGVLA